MDLTSKQNIKGLLEKRGLKPLRRFGQNFLIDKKPVEQLILSVDLSLQDTVLEIGPGIGVLTQELAKKAGKVIAVEKDRNMVDIIKETLSEFKNIEVIQQDIRYLELALKNYKVVGNLPFYLTAPVIRKFLEMREVRPYSMTLIVQKEVAQRICAKPPRMNLLAVSVQVYAVPEIISYISKNSFWPQPEVDAAIIKIVPRPGPMGDKDLFFKIVKAGFSHPRKQLLNNLSTGLKMDRQETEAWLIENNIEPTQRAETLNIENWLNLAKTSKRPVVI